MRLLFCLVLVAGCASAASTESSRRRWRVDHASTRARCEAARPAASECVDDEGLEWTECAWNSCGWDRDCRLAAQESVLAGSCGEPAYAPCGGPR